MKKKISKQVDDLFEVGETYVTKFQTGERFTLTRDPYIKKDGNVIGCSNTVYGIYEKATHLGECPLNIDRLIPNKKTITVEHEFCECCDRPMFELEYCEKCIQMTNHILGECQKCKKK